MKPAQTSVVKISRPRLPKIVQRKRLFRLLDQGRKSPVTWVSGPAGSGKTTLVASWIDIRKVRCLWYRLDEGDGDLSTFFYYLGFAAKKAAPRYKKPLPLLTPEYLLGIPAFTTRYFEDLYARLKPPSVLVLDNYQDVPETSPFHDMVRHGLANVPQGVSVIVLSRGTPSPHLSGLAATDSMRLIEWEELRFTAEEAYGMLRLHNKKVARNALDNIYERTQGWAAGLVLMTGGMKNPSSPAQSYGGFSREKIFDYFAGEILNKLDGDTKDFLLISSILPSMTAENAGKLAGHDRAGQVLSRLSRNNFFTEKHGSHANFFRYHPLFREFLQTRLKESHSREEISVLQKRAAELLEGPGQTEDAATLFIESGDWQSLIRLILKHAPEFAAQGRSGPIEAWLASMPREIVGSMPWLLFWKGICRLAFNPRESQDHFEKAFREFESGNDALGVFLAWTGVVESIEFAFESMMQLDAWIDLLPVLIRRYGGFPSKQIESRVASAMLPALVMRQPDHKDFDGWTMKALAGDDVNFKINTLFHLAFHYSYRGYFTQALEMIEACRELAGKSAASPLGMIKVRLIEQITFSLTGSCEFSRVTREGLQLAERSGIHILDVMFLGNGAIGALNNGDMDFARTCIRRLDALYGHLRPWDRSLYHLVMATEAHVTGDLQKARMHAESALRYADPVGAISSSIWCRYQTAVILHTAGDHEKADTLLEEGRAMGHGIDSILGRYEYCFIKAQFSMDRGKKDELVSHVREAMAIGRKQGIYGTYVIWQPLIMARIAVIALEDQIEVEYVQELIRRRSLVPDEPPLHVENWPWPVRIYTLGAFRLLVDGKLVPFSGKVQKRPLEMLKALIALGGTGIREDRLTDALWPEAEGDAAGASCRTTLHRLRQLIGNDDAVTVQEGRVSLDPRYCWVDAWAFERMLENADRPSPGPLPRGERIKVRGKSEIMQLEKALHLYRGHFLAGEDKPWAASPRERMKNKFLRAVERLGSCWMSAGEPKKAMECYERGLEVDDLAEEFYRGLMACSLKLGRKAGAIKVYHRCKEVLMAGLGVGPSEETENMYQRTKGN